MFLLVSCGNYSNRTEIGDSKVASCAILEKSGINNSMVEGTFTYNLPCRVMNIHQEKDGKSLLFIWLHGGVSDRSSHSLLKRNHIDYCAADDSIVNYLRNKGIKSIALFPICHKAEKEQCVAWSDCCSDIMHMIDDYVSQGVVDPKCIYLAGSSDGGTGTWDYIERFDTLFAAAMPMSCDRPRKSTIPVFFFNTKREGNCSNEVEKLNDNGSNIHYKHCPQYTHGGDAAECTVDLLDEFFSN